MNNNKQKYLTSLDTQKARYLIRKVATDVAEKTGYTGELYRDDRTEIISVIPFSDGACSVLVSVGSRSSIDVWLPSNNNDATDRNMRVRYVLYTEEWNDLLNEEFFYDYDEFMTDYLYPLKLIEEKEKED